MNPFSAIDTELLVTFTAVFVAGLAAVLGIWMERDARKPPRYAWALSALILLATFVSLMQSALDKAEQDQIKDDMARLLTKMEQLATESDDPELLELVKGELAAQSRSNPDVVEKIAQRVSDEGRDASEVLGKHLDAAEMEKVTRKGAIKAKQTDKVATTEKPADKPEEAPKRAGRDTAAKDDKGEREASAAPPRPEPTDEQKAAAVAAAQAARAERGLPPTTPAPGTEAAAAPTAPRAGTKPAAGTEAAPAPTKPVPKPTPRKGTKPTAPKKPRGR